MRVVDSVGWRVSGIPGRGGWVTRFPQIEAPFDMLEKCRSDTHACVWLACLSGDGSSHLGPRRESTGFGGPVRPSILVGVAAAALSVFASCTSGPANSPTTSSSIPATTTTRPEPQTTTTSTSVAVVTTSPSDQEVLEAWNAYWAAWVEVRASDDLDPAPLEAVASPDVVSGALALFERQRSSGLGPVETEVVLSPTVTISEPEQATVEDCVLLVPSFTDATGVWYQANLIHADSRWIVESLRIPTGGGCVPREVAEASLAGYRAYFVAESVFWDPPDPDSSLLSEVLADPQKSFIVGLLEEHMSRGIALRGQPTTHPEVIEVRSPTEVVILSCSEPDPNFGLYDIESGERLPEESSPSDGQRDLQSAVMVLEGDSWKVSDLQGQVDFACEFAPTSRGLPSV